MRWRELTAAVAATMLLGGCAAVPTVGPVREHGSRQEQVDSSVRVAPVPPAPDATAMLVVEGFLHAMGTDQADFAVARQYLTPAADLAWRPEDGTSIYADGYQLREAETSTEDQPVITLEAVLTGTLNAKGEYREASGGLRPDFGVVRDEDGQWRISRPPEGLLISRYHFLTNYTAVDLNFLDLSGSALVPDQRFFAVNSLTPETVAAAVLSGPGDWLAPAVRRTTWPSLRIEEVDSLPQGVALVQLSTSALGLTDAERLTVMAEMTQTLMELPEVTAVQFGVGSTLLPLPGTTAVTLTTKDFSELAPATEPGAGQLLAVRDGSVRVVTRTASWTEGDQIAPALTEVGTVAAVGNLSEVAGVTADGTTLAVTVAGSDTQTVLLEGRNLLRPDYSRQRELWAIGNDADAAGFTVFAAGDHAPIPVTAQDIPVETVRAFRISPDGVRIALVLDGLVVDGEAVEQLGVARIVRDAEGIRLEAFRTVSVSPPAEAGRRIVDVGWQTATELLVLLSHRVTSSVVRVDQDSALPEDIGPSEISGLVELAVVPAGQAVVRGSASLYRYEGPFNWKPITVAVDAIGYS
ncbi:MAG: LpqB family beta-propeller domain-containing protein [Actinobacteria bacterium]|nr:LpqB family beta-propeller domain-containing protein [Actinomycetota bacterium]